MVMTQLCVLTNGIVCLNEQKDANIVKNCIFKVKVVTLPRFGARI
mgnify:CR=1 FL=1